MSSPIHNRIHNVFQFVEYAASEKDLSVIVNKSFNPNEQFEILF